MRPTAVVALLGLLAAVGRADPPTVGTVTAETVVLRASPKADAADTGPLARGTTVIVHHSEGDDWLAVEPPSGAVSWISHLYLDGLDPARPFPQNAAVAADGEVRLAAGKAGVNTPLDVRRTRIPDGTLVTVLGPKVKLEDGSGWYPIAAPAGDFRYLPRSAVRLGGPVGPGFVVKSPPAAGKPEWSAPAAEKKPSGGGSAVVWPNPNHPLWAEAERAEAAGQTDKAEELYFKLAREMNGPGGNVELANLCYSRIHALRERRRTTGGGPASGPVWASSDRTQPAATDLPARKPVGGTARAEWTGAGVLRSAGRSGRQLHYALEDDRGRVVVYAVAGGGGVDLSRYVGKTVDLFGPVTFPVGLEKTGLVTVERVDASR